MAVAELTKSEEAKKKVEKSESRENRAEDEVPDTTADHGARSQRPTGREQQDPAEERRPEHGFLAQADQSPAAPNAERVHGFADREGAHRDEQDDTLRMRQLVRDGHAASITQGRSQVIASGTRN